MKKFCSKTRRFRGGFSLLEVLFTVLILAVLAAVAVPLYNNTLVQSQKSACKSNIQALANAESKYKFDNGVYVLTPGATTLLQNEGIAVFPVCPTAGGAYTITGAAAGPMTISCSTAAHTGAANNDMTLP